MSKEFLYILNWKTYLSYDESLAWVDSHKDKLEKWSEKHSIVLCPSFVPLQRVGEELDPIAVCLGAQDCAPELHGAYTGQESAESLSQVGVCYCIVGHSEQRCNVDGEDELVTQKAKVLMEQEVVPIVCIGESEQERARNQTSAVLTRQLEALKKLSVGKNMPIVAYEPIWAIGTGEVPTNDQIFQELDFIKNTLESFNWGDEVKVVYGGSISGETALELHKVENCDGFLIGKASTDIQELEKIVL